MCLSIWHPSPHEPASLLQPVAVPVDGCLCCLHQMAGHYRPRQLVSCWQSQCWSAFAGTLGPINHVAHDHVDGLCCCRYGMWDKLMSMPPPSADSRGVTAIGGSQYAAVVYHAGRLLAQTARAQVAAQQVLGLQDVTAFDLVRRSL